MAVDPLLLRITIGKMVNDLGPRVYVQNKDGEWESLKSITALDNDIVLDDVLDADIING